ncbi:bifunctional heptose 7-phosphate kinase/heptose 1-phosphate adenyltransferase [Bacteriovorax sp. DB6_IX]|uniref:bifunctional heptose 7-phosphate kinase/heptose 1-phosphate adenyltransferase n=1 Tax=Bacteriovorax sp. DB6_IX TaxID=1353530 RepID=UPI00038A31B1|nr:PfkB family carbohydrate kinase [Bacteriovorax sp. DB6_IX]EQC49709.1 putative bifunctional protein RfaE, domain I [Bacteriovorax sp. DB6_IX]
MNISISRDRFQEIVSKFEELKPILVVGDVGIDKYTSGVVSRISPEAPVPLLDVKKEWLKLGLSANISDNLKALSVDSTLCGVVGDDQNANLFENLLEENGISTWGVVRCEERPTVFKERVVTDTQQICRIDYESKKPINKEVQTKLLSRINDLSDGHDSLILEDYAKGTLTKDLIENLVKKYKSTEKIIAVDPSRTTPPLFYKGVKLLKPNRNEAEIMVRALGHYDVESVDEMASILVKELEVEKLIITLGAEGMAMIDTKVDDKVQYIPTVANEVYDVSGAGDTSISLIIASLQAGATLKEAAWISNCGAGVVVGKKGTATVNQKELLDYFDLISKKMNEQA